jgi:hypothetical protein
MDSATSTTQPPQHAVQVFLTGRGIRVHGAGCADAARDALVSDSHGGAELFASRQELVEEFYSDMLDDYDSWEDLEDEFRFLPCCKLPRTVEGGV